MIGSTMIVRAASGALQVIAKHRLARIAFLAAPLCLSAAAVKADEGPEAEKRPPERAKAGEREGAGPRDGDRPPNRRPPDRPVGKGDRPEGGRPEGGRGEERPPRDGDRPVDGSRGRPGGPDRPFRPDARQFDGPPRDPAGRGDGARHPGREGFRDMHPEMRERDPEMFELFAADHALERETRELAEGLRNGGRGGNRDELKTKLKEVVQRHFDVRQKRRELELQRIEKQLEGLRKSNKERLEKRQSLIDKRVNELIGENDSDF